MSLNTESGQDATQYYDQIYALSATGINKMFNRLFKYRKDLQQLNFLDDGESTMLRATLNPPRVTLQSNQVTGQPPTVYYSLR